MQEAVAQQAAPSEAERTRQVYPGAYFAPFQPQTARDMIDRLPGFRFDVGDDLRGFGGGAGNVLIDGARPSSKTGGIEEALNRIPASAVERIELIRGAVGASEAAGQALVANVIRKAASDTRWKAQIERASHGRVNSAGELALSAILAGWDTSMRINGAVERQPLDATRISRSAAGAITLAEIETRPSELEDVRLSAEAKRPAWGGDLALTGNVIRRSTHADTERFGFDAGMLDGAAETRTSIGVDSELDEAEFGADWTRALPGDWSFKLLSLSSLRETGLTQAVRNERPVGQGVSSSLSDNRQELFETVLRATASRGGEQKLRPEVGAEVAFNRLDSRLSLRVTNAGGVQDVLLPAANVVVEEVRGEAFGNLIWKASEAVTMETGLGVEASEIEVSGDANESRSFFAKPFATVIYDPAPGIELRLGVRRTVGQLDFGDFAASASAADDRVTAGNPQLGPDQTTRASLALDMRSKARGAVNVEVFHEWRDDILEQVVLPSGGQGVANAGSARVWGIATNASAPLSPFIPGGLIEASVELLDSIFRDPITGEERVVSGAEPPNISVQFRQDLAEAGVSWGVVYRELTDSLFYFADEESFAGDGRFWSAFVETSRFWGVKTTLELSGIGGQSFFRKRRFFDPDRSGAFTGSQDIFSRRGMSATLTVSGKF